MRLRTGPPGPNMSLLAGEEEEEDQVDQEGEEEIKEQLLD